MLLDRLGPLIPSQPPLRLAEVPNPQPGASEVLIQVSASGVCHTELDEIEGRTPPPRLPIILGHQVVGRIIDRGTEVKHPGIGDRVGVAWIFSACGQCDFCRSDRENLCPHFQATGRDHDGGYAELMAAPADFVIPIPSSLSDVHAAPLLCAGAIGYRSLRLTNLKDGQRLGLTGFGASAHLVLKMARHCYPASPVYVFARSDEQRRFAIELGAVWAGDNRHHPPRQLDAIIDTTPAWTPVAQALANLVPGGRLVINAIRKEDTDKQALVDLDYPAHLWLEKEIKSVANVTRRDVREFLDIAAELQLHPRVQTYPLEAANQALFDLKAGSGTGAKVLVT
jgi:propanol-preferring alcohol dehydrogenase